MGVRRLFSAEARFNDLEERGRGTGTGIHNTRPFSLQFTVACKESKQVTDFNGWANFKLMIWRFLLECSLYEFF